MAWFHRQRSPRQKLKKLARRYKYRWVRRICLGFVLVFGVGGGSLATYWYLTMPKLNSVFVDKDHARLFAKQTNVRYLDDSGKVFYESNAQTYQPAKVSQIKKSHNLVHALVATEDRDYFKEGGVNWGHTVKAGLDTAMHKGVSGGSTITQQLIKLTFYSTSQRDQTIKRKFQEIILASQMSHQFSKYQILTWYFNKANYGNGQVGIIAASKYYYNKKPEQLNTLEAATLAGIVNSPATYNPYLNRDAMKFRRNVVLQSMAESGYISKREFHKLAKKPVTTNLVVAKDNVENKLNQRDKQLGYNGFISAVNAQLSRYSNQLLQSTVTVKTTMNQSLQDSVNSIVAKTKFPDDKMQEAIVVLDNKNGNVLAMSGGRNQTVLGGYNRAFNVKRSSGSSIKPLLDYGPGMDMYHWTANTIVDDSKFNYPGTNQAVNDWDKRYQGKITLREALVQSRNVPAVKALVSVGLDNGQKALTALGLPSKSLFFANAIGVDTSPLAMASAYSSLANGGMRSNARVVQNVDNGVKVLKTSPIHEQVYSPQTAYLLTKILQGVINPSGTAASAKIDNVSAAGKTGTVGRNDKPDALTDGWMVGYTKSYTVAVWVGYDNPYDQKNYLTNQKADISMDLYKQTMQAASKLPGSDNSDWSAPDGVHGDNYDRNVNTMSDNFSQNKNRHWSYVPFYINMMPQNFWKLNQKHINDSSWRTQLYDKINQTGMDN